MGDFAVGTQVWGEWTPGAWYEGRVAETRGPRVFVHFVDGDQGWLDAARLIEAVASEVAGAPPFSSAPPEVGARVIGQWRDGRWYPGLVTNGRGTTHLVEFDDGDVAWLARGQIQVWVPPPPAIVAHTLADGPPRPTSGAAVIAKSGPQRRWTRGTLESVGEGAARVRFDDGPIAWVTPAWMALAPPVEGVGSLPPSGSPVLAEWCPGAWFSGVLGAAVGPRAHVRFDDGDKAWISVLSIASFFEEG